MNHKIFAMIATAAALPAQAQAQAAPAPAAATASTPAAAPSRVATESGAVQGHVVDGVLRFKGIPYAAPPVGALRWRAPQPARAWRGTHDAKAFGNDCMQRLLSTAYAPILTEPNEDCLYLNVWRPAEASARPLPVLVYIYGGGFTRGGSSSTVYGGDAFAKQGVVMVSFNYRVGRLGFFGHPALSAEHPEEPKGNYGFMDQIAALKWVQRNIARFGGDPARVTIMGESAGGFSVNVMMTSPLARGLFHGAISQSGGPSGRNPAAPPRYLAKDMPNLPSLERIGVNYAATKGIVGSDAATLARLRALPADAVVDLPEGGLEGGSPATAVWGGFAIDGKLVAESPAEVFRSGRQAPVPVLVGANTDDRPGADIPAGRLELAKVIERFGPLQDRALVAYDPQGLRDVPSMARDIGMDAMMIEPERFVAVSAAAQGMPAWQYRFAYKTEAIANRWSRGAPHAAELAYVFDTVAPYYGPARSATDQAVARMLNAYWANFVKTGNPNGAGLPAWPAYEPRTDHVLVVGGDGTAQGKVDPWKDRLELTAAVADVARP